MLALLSVFAVVTVSLLITRVATVALEVTGMSREDARFQARSALTGVGFTTAEAEQVVNHPVRRRIVMVLMLLGSAGVASVAATLILSFGGTSGGQTAQRVAVLVGGLLVVLVLARSSFVDRRLSRLIRFLLGRFTDLEVRDLHQLLHLGGGFGVSEWLIEDDDELAGKRLCDVDLRAQQVAVLGIERRAGGYDPVPAPDARVEPGDVLIVYAKAD